MEAHAGPRILLGQPAWFSALGEGLESFQVGDSEAWGSLPLGARPGALLSGCWAVAWSPAEAGGAPLPHPAPTCGSDVKTDHYTLT